MRHLLTIVTAAALCGGLTWFGVAEEPKAAVPANSDQAGRSQAPANADLRAEIHRTMAALVEARSAEKPDQAKIDELAVKLQQLRGKLRSQNAAAGGNAAAGWGCPWGGPGMGFGCGRGCGCGCGWGGGRGWCGGMGPGAGRGWGGGAGVGRGLGPGAGQGLPPGGAAYVDQDNNGVCDHYELRHAVQK
jgi:hypothetical protein